MSEASGLGFITVSDGTILKLKVSIVDIREIEGKFSPFGGVFFDVNAVGGVSAYNVPEELKKAVADKRLAPSEPPQDGWEILEIKEQKPAIVEEVVASSKGRFMVRVVGEAVMVARNMNYKTLHNEPVYWVSWVYKISWRPVEK
ncbi:MAG: hypothetical protein LZ170_00010 [Thaumarchaeota archaeon]|jgi:hypothetical protein|nr:hypothetical protein [Candidatus Terraquivivens yellowstonensis]